MTAFPFLAKRNLLPARVFLPLNALLLGVLLFLAGCKTINQTRERLRVPENTVLFSFDDGPNGAVTKELLDVLQRHHIKAVFCLLGENAEAYPELVKRMRKDGHVIANHGQGDVWAVGLSTARFLENLLEGERVILWALDEKELSPRLYRPHGGFYTNAQQRLYQEQGYELLGVSARAYDAALNAYRKNLVLRRIMKAVEKEKGGILLLHDAKDTHSGTEKALIRNPQGAFNRSWIPGITEELIRSLDEKGYTLRDIDILGILAPRNREP
jgi:peptidoglycan/xylan/chitin deacetylase (PgdA/CDA1 family)